jgi:hypothetical protein
MLDFLTPCPDCLYINKPAAGSCPRNTTPLGNRIPPMSPAHCLRGTYPNKPRQTPYFLSTCKCYRVACVPLHIQASYRLVPTPHSTPCCNSSSLFVDVPCTLLQANIPCQPVEIVCVDHTMLHVRPCICRPAACSCSHHSAPLGGTAAVHHSSTPPATHAPCRQQQQQQ